MIASIPIFKFQLHYIDAVNFFDDDKSTSITKTEKEFSEDYVGGGTKGKTAYDTVSVIEILFYGFFCCKVSSFKIPFRLHFTLRLAA